MEVLGTRGCESYKTVPRPGLRRCGEDFMKEVALEVTLVGQESTLVILITMCSTCQEKMKHKHVISVSLL